MSEEPIDFDAVEELCIAHGATLHHLSAAPVEVEVRLLRGLLGLVRIIGLGDTAARESRERVRSAIMAAGYAFPEHSMLINLAPADLRKAGPGLDLPIACAILAASGQIPESALRNRILWGELALTGKLRAVNGAIPVALLARQQSCEELIAPASSATELFAIRGLKAAVATTLLQVLEHLRGEHDLEPPEPIQLRGVPEDELWDSIVGQDAAKESVLVAASGGHHLLMMGPPGSGKSLLARSLSQVLPDLDEEQSLEVSSIHSAAGLSARTQTRRPPLRAPHCSISVAGLAGGGLFPRPGEMTLAHRGVLFLDELPQFRREVCDLLRAPLEEGVIDLSRAGHSLRFPARFLMVAAMNPCPCGNAGEPHQECSCSTAEIQRYRARVSGPVLDRIDLTIRVPFVPAEDRKGRSTHLAANARARVVDARERQLERNGGLLNSELCGPKLDRAAKLSSTCEDWLYARIDRLRLSMRAHHRLLRVARTMADLERQDKIELPHLARALAHREPLSEFALPKLAAG